jgi:hypothetical protein
MNKHETCDKSGPLTRGRFYRFGGILSLLCACVTAVMSLYVAHVMLGPLILVAILSMIAAILFVGGFMLLALGTIIEQLRDIKGHN